MESEWLQASHQGHSQFGERQHWLWPLSVSTPEPPVFPVSTLAYFIWTGWGGGMCLEVCCSYLWLIRSTQRPDRPYSIIKLLQHETFNTAQKSIGKYPWSRQIFISCHVAQLNGDQNLDAVEKEPGTKYQKFCCGGQKPFLSKRPLLCLPSPKKTEFQALLTDDSSRLCGRTEHLRSCCGS